MSRRDRILAQLYDKILEIHAGIRENNVILDNFPPSLLLLRTEENHGRPPAINLGYYTHDEELISFVIEIYRNEPGVIGTIMMIEAYTREVKHKLEEGEDPEELIKELAETIQDSDYDNLRNEALIFLGDVDGTRLLGKAEIVKNKKGQKTLGDLMTIELNQENHKLLGPGLAQGFIAGKPYQKDDDD